MTHPLPRTNTYLFESLRCCNVRGRGTTRGYHGLEYFAKLPSAQLIQQPDTFARELLRHPCLGIVLDHALSFHIFQDGVEVKWLLLSPSSVHNKKEQKEEESASCDPDNQWHSILCNR